MKCKIKRVLIVLSAVFCTALILSTFTAFADPEDDAPEYFTEAPYIDTPTEAPYEPETEAPYEPETEAPYEPETEAPYEPETEAPYEPETEAPYEQETEAPEVPEYIETIPYEDDLPPAPTDPDPTAAEISQGDNGDMTYGYVSWGCVIIGVIVVIIVLISNKTHYYGGGGKHRYDEGDKITGQKHLLNDDYYNNRKHNSYYDKDNRK